jgi:hypothetical protein
VRETALYPPRYAEARPHTLLLLASGRQSAVAAMSGIYEVVHKSSGSPLQATTRHSSLAARDEGTYGLGPGVGRGLAVGADRGVGVGLGVDVGVAVTVAVAVGVAVDVGVAVAVGVGVGPPAGTTRTK